MLIKDIFPPPETALELPSEELAMFLLKHLHKLDKSGNSQSLNLHNYLLPPDIDNYAGEQVDAISRAITEAWMWLEREVMIAPVPRKGRDWLYVTRRGEQLLTNSDVSTYLKGKLIPEGTLDVVLTRKVRPLFIRGDYDTAVFQAFKEVEIRVRKAANMSVTSIGVDLMSKAFNLDNGALTDFTQAVGERQATSDLFAGAIGLFKNPSSHRDVNWEDASECAELIYLADYLLRLVERHTKKRESPS